MPDAFRNALSHRILAWSSVSSSIVRIHDLVVVWQQYARDNDPQYDSTTANEVAKQGMTNFQNVHLANGTYRRWKE